MTRRYILAMLAFTLVGLSSSLRAADEPASGEPAALPFWVAGGVKQGASARKMEPVLETFGLEWAGQKFWGMEKNGELTYGRPGKDETEKGTEYFFIRSDAEVGVVDGKKLLRLELSNDDNAKSPPRALFFGFEVGEEGDKQFAGFFYLAGAKGEKLSSVFSNDKEKDPAGRLIVTAKPAGKGAARTYEFAFPKGNPELLVPAKPAKTGK